jgi:CHAT domain-containing protein
VAAAQRTRGSGGPDLDAGTVWLSYLIDDDTTMLFVVTPEAESAEGGLRVVRLPVGRPQLEEEVAIFRGLILRGRSRASVETALLVQGRKLYRLLLAPAGEPLARATRLLISPDGPLHALPFAALVRPAGQGEFLMQWKPIHTVASATLYAELRRGRRDRARTEGSLVVLANPLLKPLGRSKPEPGDNPLRRYRAGLPPLPGAREEVRALANLFGRRAVVYTGAAATETRLAQLPVRPRYLHFACHALLDRRSPLDSGLALAPTAGRNGGDAGLLQAWEIFHRVRLDADLVTLSACDSGLGREAAGEGMIGLTRAFHYAGARSVLSSLWPVSDRSTPILMARFYARLHAGFPTDLALAEAQRQLLRDRDLAHPYAWAGFALNGDWR